MFKQKLQLLLLLPLIFLNSAQASDIGTAAPEEEVTVETKPPTEAEAKSESKGEFWFRVRARDHMYSAAMWNAEVRVHLAEGEWPGIEILDDGAIQEVSIKTILSIEGLSVPPSSPDFTRWHAATDREASRFDASMNHTWKLLSVAETGIIKNPVERDGIVYGQIFLMIGGNRIDLGKALVHDGYASETERDWGQR